MNYDRAIQETHGNLAALILTQAADKHDVKDPIKDIVEEKPNVVEDPNKDNAEEKLDVKDPMKDIVEKKPNVVKDSNKDNAEEKRKGGSRFKRGTGPKENF